MYSSLILEKYSKIYNLKTLKIEQTVSKQQFSHYSKNTFIIPLLIYDSQKQLVGRALTDGLKWRKEDIKDSLFNLRNEIDSKYKIITSTDDTGDDGDDGDEDGKRYALAPQEIIQRYLIEPVQNLAYNFYKKKKVSEKNFNFIVGEAIKFDKIIPDDKKNEIGALVEELKLLRNFRNPKSRYLSSLKANYRSFRRANKDYYVDTFNSRAISYPELDIVILAYFKAYKAFKMDKLDEELMRRQIFVDEITDFSAVQIAIMDNLLQKNSKCFFGAGDINQRLTEIGVSSVDDFKWALEQVQIEEIKIPYRQSKQLFELSTKIIGARVDSYEQPKYIDNDRLDPVAGYSLDSMEKQADWLATRIIEIERKIETLPSIAILVNTEDKVKKLADELNKRLKHNNIAVDACENGRIIGNDHSVRVFCIDYIKGLEFEAAFFMDVDELADLKPRIFEKYLYVGISRAATFLGLTSRGRKMPDNQKDKVENKPKHPGFNIRKKEKPKDFLPLSEYNGDKKDYLRFAKERGWAPFLPFNEQCDGVEMGLFKEEDLSEYY